MNCPYCNEEVILVDSQYIYGQGHDYGKMYACKNFPECDTYVGCHKGTNRPLGRMADKELRQWKRKTHEIFDPLWQKWGMSRKEAYSMLAKRLGIKFDECHIGMFDVATCKKAINLLSAKPIL